MNVIRDLSSSVFIKNEGLCSTHKNFSNVKLLNKLNIKPQIIQYPPFSKLNITGDWQNANHTTARLVYPAVQL